MNVSQYLIIAEIDITPILYWFGNLIYLAMALCAIYGLFCIVMLVRRVKQKSFPGREAAATFLDDVGELMEQNRFDDVIAMCDEPELWSRAVPQLVTIGVENRHKPVKKVRQIVAGFFSREILSEFDVRVGWVNTIIKSAPMLGLLGTVTGMIAAFKQIAGSGDSGVNPADLASDISFALWTTAGGLAIAIPLVILMSTVQTKITGLEDSVDDHITTFLDDLEAAQLRSQG